jgi:hypothetical protein
MRRCLLPLELLWALAWVAQPVLAAGTTNSFFTAGITLNNITKAVRPGQRVVFENGSAGADGSYQLRLQLRNAGSKTAAVQSLVTAVYLGTNSSLIGNGSEPILTLPVQVSWAIWLGCPVLSQPPFHLGSCTSWLILVVPLKKGCRALAVNMPSVVGVSPSSVVSLGVLDWAHLPSRPSSQVEMVYASPCQARCTGTLPVLRAVL